MPKVAIIGEAWSAFSGKDPFTPYAQQLVKAILGQLNIAATDMFFDNALPKSFAGTPSKMAVDQHREELFERIRAWAPQVVIACGTWANYAILRSADTIQNSRGYIRWSADLNAYVIPTFHPSAIQYNPTVFDEFSNDLQKILIAKDMPAGGVPELVPKYEIITDSRVARRHLEKLSKLSEGIVSVDIETAGFDYFADPILSIGVGPAANFALIFAREVCEDLELRTLFNTALGNPNVTYVYQNGKFDVQFLRADTDRWTTGYVKKTVVKAARCDFDTMLAHYCCDERQQTHGLKVWAREEFGAPDWDAALKEYLPTRETSYANIPPEILYKYQAYDVVYTRMGYFRFKEKMIADNTYECFKNVYTPAVEAFCQIEYEGIPVDRDTLQRLYDEAQPRIAAAKVLLERAAIEAGWDPMKYARARNATRIAEWERVNLPLPTAKRAKMPGGSEIPKSFNPASHPQLSYVAYDLCKMPLFEGKKTCAKDAVDLYRHRHPFWKALAEYKEVTDVFGTFIKGMLERTDADDRIRPDFILHGTRTGRISCADPNMQNLPRGSIVKDFFVADPDCVVVNADYKTLEVVIAAVLSGDPDMQRPFIEKLDFHSETAHAVFQAEIARLKQAVAEKDRRPIDTFLERTLMLEIRHSVAESLDAENFDEAYQKIWHHLRFLTKFVTFGIMYGRGAQSLATGELNCPVYEAQQYMNQFFARYPKYSSWLQKQEQHALKHGYVQNIFGFKRRWPYITADNRHEIRNQSWNTPVQGSAAQICIMALCRAQKELVARGWGRVLFTVHDSIVYSVQRKHLQEALTYIREEMTKDIIGTPVKLDVELEVGPTYKRVEEVVWNDTLKRWVPKHSTPWLDEVMEVAYA